LELGKNEINSCRTLQFKVLYLHGKHQRWYLELLNTQGSETSICTAGMTGETNLAPPTDIGSLLKGGALIFV